MAREALTLSNVNAFYGDSHILHGIGFSLEEGHVLALLGPDRIIPRTDFPKDFPNYDGDYAQYPVDIARMRRVVQAAAEKSGWGQQKSGNGMGMGMAVHRSFLTYVATVIQAEVKDGQVIVHRVDTAVDAGTIINPTTVRQQFEGAAVMGTSLAFYGEITATGESTLARRMTEPLNFSTS